MNILFFSPYYLPYISGITTYPALVLQHLAKKHEVRVLTFAHDRVLKNKEMMEGVQVIRMPFSLRLSKGFIAPQSFGFYKKELEQAEVVLLNIPNVEGLPLAVLAKRKRKRLISIYHCEVDLGDGIANHLINWGLNSAVRLQLSLSDEIVAYTKDYVTAHAQVGNFLSKVRFVSPPVKRLPVDGGYLRSLKKQKGTNHWVGFAGRVAREKGLEYLIKAVKHLGHDVEVVLAGPAGNAVVGENEYFESIQNLFQKTRVKHRFLGTLRNGELGAFYTAIDVLALPSINHTEAFGMVQVEAMQLGTPVVASNLPGVRVPIQETGMGELAEPADVVGLQSALGKILADKKVYAGLRQVETAKKLFNVQRTYEAIEQIIAG